MTYGYQTVGLSGGLVINLPVCRAGDLMLKYLMSTSSIIPGQQTPKSDNKIAGQAAKTVGNLTAQRFAGIGRTTRVQGHVSAHNRRSQGKKDSR